MKFVLKQYDEFQNAQVYFGKDPEKWLEELDGLDSKLPLFLLYALRDVCFENQWVDGVLALKKSMENNPHFSQLWGKDQSLNNSALLAAVQSDCLPLVDLFLPSVSMSEITDLFFVLVGQENHQKRPNYPDILNRLTEKMLANPNDMFSKNFSIHHLEEALIKSSSKELWEQFASVTDWKTCWLKAVDEFVEAHQHTKKLHEENVWNKQLLNLWKANPDPKLVSDQFYDIVKTYQVFAPIVSAVEKDRLLSQISSLENTPRKRRL